MHARQRTRVKVFIFKNFQGAQISIFFCENWLEASFYNKKKSKNTNLKFELKNYFIFTLEKARFWFLKKNTHKKCFFMFRLWFSFKNNKHTIVILFGILKMHQKKLLTAKNAILVIFEN